MGYFNELPNIAYQSPLSHKNSSKDFIIVKNLFRRTKLFDHLRGSATALNKVVIENGERPDTLAERIYGDSRLDYIIILTAGISNINHEWPLQDHQVFNYALEKYGTQENLYANHHYETFEIRDDKNRQILPPKLIVDIDFKIDGTSFKNPSTRYTVLSDSGNRQLDDKNEYTVKTDNIATAITNLQYEYLENEKKREIEVLQPPYLQAFINDLRQVVRYDKSSRYITSSLASTENTEVVNP